MNHLPTHPPKLVHLERTRSTDAIECGEAHQTSSLRSNSRTRDEGSIWYGSRTVVFGSWLNVLLIFIPSSWTMASVLPHEHILVFVFCILSMIPLVKFHDLAVSELAIRFGGIRTGLLNASMSNIVEIVVGIIALQKCELKSDPLTSSSSLVQWVRLTQVMNATAINADWLVESMDGIDATIGKPWVALILLPAVSSIAEIVTAMNTSVQDRLSTSVSIAVGSTIQTALCVIPFIVTLAWCMGKPLGMLFDPFESIVLYISVQTMSFVVSDGRSNWLGGAQLTGMYFIIAIASWFYPGSGNASNLGVCCV